MWITLNWTQWGPPRWAQEELFISPHNGLREFREGPEPRRDNFSYQEDLFAGHDKHFFTKHLLFPSSYEFSLFPFKKNLPENHKKIRKEKRLNIPASPFPNSCQLYFYLKYLWTWDNVYFYDEHSLGVKIKGQCSSIVLFLKSTFLFFKDKI